MNTREAMDRLQLAYPKWKLTPEQERLWIEKLRPLEGPWLLEAVELQIEQAKFAPSIADMRRLASEARAQSVGRGDLVASDVLPASELKWQQAAKALRRWGLKAARARNPEPSKAYRRPDATVDDMRRARAWDEALASMVGESYEHVGPSCDRCGNLGWQTGHTPPAHRGRRVYPNDLECELFVCSCVEDYWSANPKEAPGSQAVRYAL